MTSCVVEAAGCFRSVVGTATEVAAVVNLLGDADVLKVISLFLISVPRTGEVETTDEVVALVAVDVALDGVNALVRVEGPESDIVDKDAASGLKIEAEAGALAVGLDAKGEMGFTGTGFTEMGFTGNDVVLGDPIDTAVDGDDKVRGNDMADVDVAVDAVADAVAKDGMPTEDDKGASRAGDLL